MLRKFSKINHLLLVLNIRVQKTIHDLPLFGKLQLSNMEWLSFQITWILLPYKNLRFVNAIDHKILLDNSIYPSKREKKMMIC
jgi:hypothetical protein